MTPIVASSWVSTETGHFQIGPEEWGSAARVGDGLEAPEEAFDERDGAGLPDGAAFSQFRIVPGQTRKTRAVS
jgi:hypothetical protein